MNLLSIKDISRELEVPESNLRYYRDRFDDFLPSLGQGRKRRYKKEALDVFRFIVQGFQEDKTTDQIAEDLPKHFPRKLDFADQEESYAPQALSKISEPSSSSPLFQLLQAQARTLERFSRFLFSRGTDEEDERALKSEQHKLKKGVVLLHRDVKKLKSSQDNSRLLEERCLKLEEQTQALDNELQTMHKRLTAIEAQSQRHYEELRTALRECLLLMQRILECEDIGTNL